jgi:hypothetical protein
VVTKFNAAVVFVHGADNHSKATSRADLEWTWNELFEPSAYGTDQ